MDSVGQNGKVVEHDKGLVLRDMRMKSIDDVLEEVEIVIDTHFDEFS